MRRATKTLAGVVATVAAGVGACAALWPDRFVVNAPVRHMLFGQGIEAPAPQTVAARLRGPAGTAVSRFAEDLPNVRFLRFTPGGDLLASLPRSGRVVRLLAGPRRRRALRRATRGRRRASTGRTASTSTTAGCTWRRPMRSAGSASTPRRARRRAPSSGSSPACPAAGNHWTRTLRFGPDGWMYVSIGSSLQRVPRGGRAAGGDACATGRTGRAGRSSRRGLRNSVGFDWRPEDGQLYATDNGRDLLGDDFPPCELNRVVRAASTAGRSRTGTACPTPTSARGRRRGSRRRSRPSTASAPTTRRSGMTFLRGEGVPTEYRGAAVVALHGSWNRTRKDGYKVVSLHWGADGRIEERDFLTGFLGSDRRRRDRPAGGRGGGAGRLRVRLGRLRGLRSTAWRGARPGGRAAPVGRRGG